MSFFELAFEIIFNLLADFSRLIFFVKLSFLFLPSILAIHEILSSIPFILFFSNINLVEQFNPLIQIDLELKNSLRLSFDVIKDRAISLSLANNLITESWGNEYSIGLGYRARNLKLWSRFSSNSNRFIGDLNTKLDFNIRKNLTVIRNLNIDDNKVSAGQSVFSLRISADYALNRNFSTIFFYDHLFSKYEISTAFPQTNIRSGFTLRYNFGN